MLLHYIGLVDITSDGHLHVMFPDFPGCISSGDSFQGLFDNATEALELHLEGVLEDDKDWCGVPSSYSDILSKVHPKDVLYPIVITVVR